MSETEGKNRKKCIKNFVKEAGKNKLVKKAVACDVPIKAKQIIYFNNSINGPLISKIWEFSFLWVNCNGYFEGPKKSIKLSENYSFLIIWKIVVF